MSGTTAKKKAETNAPVSNEEQAVEPLELGTEAFDVTQPPPSQNDGQKVDYKKTTMPVVGDPDTPADFNPQDNR